MTFWSDNKFVVPSDVSAFKFVALWGWNGVKETRFRISDAHIIIATTLCSTIISFFGFIANTLSFNNEVTRSQACLVTKTVSFLNLLSNLGWSLYKVIKYNSSAAAAMELDESQVYTTSTINFGNMNLNALTALLPLASTAICCGWKVALA